MMWVLRPRSCLPSRASERCNASRLKVVLRNGGCPGLSGGRSDSPHRGIPQQHIMRLWWNQSLVSCGWWLVGDPSVRPSILSVHTFIYVRPWNVLPCQSALLRQRRQSSIDRDRDRAATITRHYPRIGRDEDFSAENWTFGFLPTHVSSSDLSFSVN